MRNIVKWISALLILVIATLGFAQEDVVNTKIWSSFYWKKMIKEGKAEANPAIQIQPAVYKGSKISSRSVVNLNSPDVPVTTDPNTTQSENSIFVNPLDNNKVFNSNNSTNNPVSSVYGTSAYMTPDGGATWYGQATGTGGPNSGDPAAVIDLNGTYFVGYIADNSGQGVAHSFDEGATWTHVQVAPNPGSLADKNHMWVDNSPSSPHEGNLYSAWTAFGGSNDNNIVISRSTDGGMTWSAPLNISSAVNAGSHNQGVNVTTGPNGEVYAIWAIYDSWPSDETAMAMAVSTDGGATFAPATRIITNIRGIRSTETSKNQRVASFPSATCDISGGGRNGWIYVSWPNVGVPGINTGSDIDVYMARSEDGGSTWTTPVRVNQDAAGLGKEHYMNWMTCDPMVGNLSVIFYDDRNVSSSQCEVFVANSVDGGNTWEDFQVSDVAFTPGPIPGLAGGYFGDYIGISANGGKVYPVWTDNRDGRAMAYVSPFALSDPFDPNAPGSFKAYSDYMTPASMDLTWNDPTNFANGDTLYAADFNIQIIRDGVVLDSVAGGVMQYTDTGLTDGQLYNYTLFTKVIADDSTSLEVSGAWTAGGAKTPKSPQNFYITQEGNDLKMHWENPLKNVDDTPMDDFAGIKLYEDGSYVTTFARTSSDTGLVDSALYTPPAGTHQYYVTAIDAETPVNESAASGIAYSPISVPFFDDFLTGPLPNAGYWLNTNGEVTGESVNPPSAPNALALDGHPTGGDNVELLPVDLSGFAGQGLVLSYWYQPQGSGNAPETGDSLIIEFKNDLGNWINITSYPGTGTVPFVNELIAVDAENAGSGATFFHPTFQIRFRNIGTSSSSSHFDHWFVDDVFLGFATNNPKMAVTPNALSDTLLIGATSSQQFEIFNNQPAPSTLNYTITEVPAVDWLSVSQTSGTLTSSKSDMISVMFDAANMAAGDYSAELIIAGNDTTNAEDTVVVNLKVNEAPVIAVNPDSVHFALGLGDADSTVVSIINTGGGPLQIFSIETEEVNNRFWLPLYNQVQKPFIPEAKGTNGTFKGNVTEGSGGPDPFGHKWIDSDDPAGPTYQFTDISATGTVVNLIATGTFDPKDEGMATINLPWDVKFYGQNYSQLQVNSNGFIMFDMNFFANAFSNAAIPSSADPNGYIAPFWDDLEGDASGDIYYQEIGNTFVIQWYNWNHYASTGDGLNFQVILFKNSGTVHFVYDNMAAAQTDATIGMESMDGSMGLQISYDQAYVHSQLLTKISKGADWLSANVTSGTVPPGGQLDVTVKADAQSLVTGDYLGSLVISSNDPVNALVKLPKVSVNVSGTPEIQISPNNVGFDTVLVGSVNQMSAYVKNVGTDPLMVTDVQTPSTTFTIDTTNFIVNPADSIEVMFTFTPTVAGFDSAVFNFISNDPNNPQRQILAWGVALEAPVAVITPNFTNPIQVLTGDSLDISINISNTGGSDLVWNATAAGWLTVLDNNGVVAPGTNTNMNLRVYGSTSTVDTMMVAIMTNDPLAPQIDVEIIRDLLTGINDQVAMPTTFGVEQNYPNPFNPTTRIKFQVPQTANVRLVVYNVLGQVVRTLVDNRMEAGYHVMEWDGLNELGNRVSSGIYIYKFESENFSKVMKMMLMK